MAAGTFFGMNSDQMVSLDEFACSCYELGYIFTEVIALESRKTDIIDKMVNRLMENVNIH